MRGGKRDGAGRPTGSTIADSFDDQMSFRCWQDMKKAVKKAAKQRGLRGYQAMLRYIVEEWMKAGEQSFAPDENPPS